MEERRSAGVARGMGGSEAGAQPEARAPWCELPGPLLRCSRWSAVTWGVAGEGALASLPGRALSGRGQPI